MQHKLKLLKSKTSGFFIGNLPKSPTLRKRFCTETTDFYVFLLEIQIMGYLAYNYPLFDVFWIRTAVSLGSNAAYHSFESSFLNLRSIRQELNASKSCIRPILILQTAWSVIKMESRNSAHDISVPDRQVQHVEYAEMSIQIWRITLRVVSKCS